MELTLANFKEVIDPTILQRGQDYYAGGHVIDLEEQDDGRWIATVEGTDGYQVAIIANAQDGSLTWVCDCPYEWGPVCKHVAAALYALEAAGSTASPKKPEPRRKRKTRADRVRDALATLSSKERYNLLLELALDDRDVAHLILARYGTDKESDKGHARLVQDALRLGQGRQGFLDYWGAARAAKGVRELLHRAESHHSRGQLQQAIAIYQAVIEGVIPAMSKADDSMGALGDCIHFALDGLQRGAEELTPPERAELFAFCASKAPKEPYVEWDWGWDLAKIAARLVETPPQRATLFAALDQMAARYDKRGWSSDFDRERAAMVKFSIIRRQDDDAAVQEFLEAHLRYERVRMALARRHLEKGDLAAARRLCLEWLEQRQTSKSGLRPDFMAILRDAAVAEGDLEGQIRLTEALFRETGRFEYYEQLKALVGADAWPDYRSGFMERIEQGGRRRVDLGALYIAEEMWESLLTLVQTHPRAAPYYHEHLATRYPQALSEAYEELVLATLEQKVNRQGYREACGYLQRMRQLGQDERVAVLVARFRQQYKQRRALLDELNKVFGR